MGDKYMVDLWNLKVSEYRDLLDYNSELRSIVVEILKYGRKLKNAANINTEKGINGKRACYGMILLLNGWTSFDKSSKTLINAAVNANLLDKSFINGNFSQVATKYWNTKNNGEDYVNIFFGDIVINLSNGIRAKSSGKGLSKKMQRFMRNEISNMTIKDTVTKVKELFTKSEYIDNKEKEKRIKELYYFIDAVNKFSVSSEIITDEIETDEITDRELIYTKHTKDIHLTEVMPPCSIPASDQDYTFGTIKSINEQQAAMKEKNRKKKGNFGEELAIQIEKDRLTKLGHPELISRINHVAKRKDGLGYDIESVDIDAAGNVTKIYIEVKTTSGDINRPFYISNREVAASKKYGDSYYIYRIFGVTENTDDIQYYKLKGNVRDTCSLKEVSFIATAKN